MSILFNYKDYVNYQDCIHKLGLFLNSQTHSGIYFVAIDGYYGAGKSTLAHNLAHELRRFQNTALVLATDSFMRFSRKERTQSMERYNDHANWYDLQQIEATLNDLRKFSQVHIENLYNHRTGQKDQSLQIDPTNVRFIILEGMYAFHSKLEPIVDLGILVKATHKKLLLRVIQRDTMERHLDKKTIRNRYWIINGERYQSYFQSRISHADLLIDTTLDHQLSVELPKIRHK